MAARVHALAKHPKSSKGLYFPITSDQRPLHSVAKTWSRCRSGAWLSSFVDCIHVKRINGCYASCRGKSLSCGTTHSTGCTRKSSGILVGDIGGSGHSERRKPADKGAKGIPPRREVISAPFGTRRCQNGVSPNSVKCRSIAKSGLLRAGPV